MESWKVNNRGQCGRVSDDFRESVPEGRSFGPESLVPLGSVLMVVGVGG